MNIKSLIKPDQTKYIVLLALIIYAVAKALHGGTDINVYLHASTQFFNGENIYADNPYNNYLYSPLFALLLRPLSILDFSYARAISAALNILLAFRLWLIVLNILKEQFNLNRKIINWWSFAVLFISFVVITHNINLGQITILILWLMFEGLYQIIIKERLYKGAFLLALGVNIKIIPLIGLFYLFFKGKYKALFVCSFMIVGSLLLPALIVGHDHNITLLKNWEETIQPTKNKYVFENNRGTHSLNAILPAYFYTFGENQSQDPTPQIADISHNTLVIILNSIRVIFLLSSLYLIFYKPRDNKQRSLFFFWELSYLALVSALIFPHQQKYAMLYYVPAGAYMLIYILLNLYAKPKLDLFAKIMISVSSILMLSSALMSRDVVGHNVVNLFDYYHILGLINMVFLVLLLLVKPDKLIKINKSLS